MKSNSDGVGTRSVKHASSLKEKAAEEFREFWAIAIYLVLMFSAFTSYRRLILSESGVTELHYGFAVVKGLVLAKVILVGQALRLGRRFEAPPLIRAVLLKSVVFGLFFCLFTILEHVTEGLLRHKGWADIMHSLLSAGRDEILARSIMVIVTFIPFFSFLETDRVLGKGKLFALFFRKRISEVGHLT
jgi:hypothetical protein